MDQAGTTLVEIMVAAGLFGVLSLGVMGLFAEHSKQAARAKNDTQLTEQLTQFSHALEVLLSNTTQVIQCGCSSGSPACIYADAGTDHMTQASCPSPLLVVEIEDSTDPSQLASANSDCILSGGVTGAHAAYQAKGCKRRLIVECTPPAQAPNAAPGTLTLTLRGNSSQREIAKLTGVTSLRCGQLLTENGNASPDQFRIQLGMKTRSKNTPLGTLATDPNFEGWHSGEPGFRMGTHRSIITDIAFRNFNVQGVQFGKPYSRPVCLRDNTTTSDPNLCCSGYARPNGTDFTCLRSDDCDGGGTPAAPNVTDQSCCSHMRNAAGDCL